MKKIIIFIWLLSSVSMMANVTTVTPYAGIIDYGNNPDKSYKDFSAFAGFHASSGNLKHLIDFDYSHLATKFKNSDTEDLSQDDFLVSYARYYRNAMYKIGIHYINTNDEILGSGIIGIASVGGYNYFGYNKFSYGVDGYYSSYSNAHNESYEKKDITVIQLSPYLSYYSAVSINFGNTFSIKVNYEDTPDYIKSSYTSFEVSDTIFYKSFFSTFKAVFGSSKSLIDDGGVMVYNSLDKIKNIYNVKVGYYMSKKSIFTFSYKLNKYREYEEKLDNDSSTAILSFSYRF